MSQSSVAGPAVLPLPEKLWVRIHPYNPAQGYRKKTFLVHGFPTAFTVDAGWYELDARLAVQLKKFLNNANDEGSKPIFQVVTIEKARDLDLRARRKAAEADAPNRIASNPLQDRADIPKPVNFDVLKAPIKTPIAPVRAAPASPAALEEALEPQGAIADLLQDVVDESADAIEEVFESAPEEGHGDLTTEDLAPVPAPKPVPAPAPAPPAGKLVPRATKKPK